MSRFLTLSVNAGVAMVTLTQPEIRNAFSDASIAELTRALSDVAARSDVRALVLAAEGPAFCAGANLGWMQQMAGYSHAENLADAAQLEHMLHALYTCPVPTIARIQGDALAGGVGLVACCDMAVAAEGVSFGLTEVKLGLIPATIAPYVLRAMGARAGHRYFLTGERFSAEQALHMGLVQQVVPADALDAAVDGWLKHLLQAGPAAAVACKKLLLDVGQREIDEALRARTVHRLADIRASEEGKEGVQAFIDRRKPTWMS